MITITIAAIFCAICTIYLIIPIAQAHRHITHSLMVALPVLSLALYMLLGAPGIPSQAAMFDKNEARQQARSMVRGELEMMESLSNDPENTELMLALGSIRLANDRTADAIHILSRAHDLAPKNKDIRLQLGAAYFVSGLYEAEQSRKENAMENFKKALKVAPSTAPYKNDLKKIIADF
ncbi:MAG: hypothetical protein DHS20C02_00330 [Micavibrio sp.]|nr:MAG: hypothetical protein DHS20C02_00330 [Micavibrio sp.]